MNKNRKKSSNQKGNRTTDDVLNSFVKDQNLLEIQSKFENNKNANEASQQASTAKNRKRTQAPSKKRISTPKQKKIQKQMGQLQSELNKLKNKKKGILDWEIVGKLLSGQASGNNPYKDIHVQDRVMRDIGFLYADYLRAKKQNDTNPGNMDKYDKLAYELTESIGPKDFKTLLDDPEERLLDYLRQEYITWANSTPDLPSAKDKGIELSFGKSIRDVKPEFDMLKARRQELHDKGLTTAAKALLRRITEAENRQQSLTDDRIRLQNFQDPKLNSMQREMFENRIDLLVEMGDMDAVNHIIINLAETSFSMDENLQKAIFNDNARKYASNLAKRVNQRRNELIQKVSYVNTAGAMPDKSSEYRFLFKDIKTVDQMQNLIAKKFGPKGKIRMQSLRKQLNDDIARIAARDFALMSNTEEIFNDFVKWAQDYRLKKRLALKLDLTDETMIMAMMNAWYKSQEKVTVYRALAITDNVAKILLEKGLQSPASFYASTDTNAPIANYDAMLREQPFIADIKRRTKKNVYVQQQRRLPYPSKTRLLPVGQTVYEDSGAGSVIAGTKQTKNLYYKQSVVDAKNQTDVDADMAQSVTFHPEVAKTVASDPDFTGSQIPNFVMFKMEIPKSAIIKPEVIDPKDDYDLIPKQGYVSKKDQDNNEKNKKKIDLSNADASQTESWIYGNIPADWIVSYENITDDAYTIDQSVFDYK